MIGYTHGYKPGGFGELFFIQLIVEQHVFELHGSIYMHIFFSIVNIIVLHIHGWIHGYREPQMPKNSM